MRITHRWLLILGVWVALAGCGPSTLPPTPTPIGSTPVSTALAPTKGFGVSRAAFETAFGSADLGFKFGAESLEQGQRRVIGWSPDGLGMLDLVGPADNLAHASVTGPLSDRPTTQRTFERLIQVADPTWLDAGSAWLTSSIGTAQQDLSTQQSHGDHVYTLAVSVEKGTMSLDVRAR